MDLLWLRVAAVLYGGASIAAFPGVLHGLERWRKVCVHLAGLAFFFHFVSAVEMLVKSHNWVPVGVREAESLLGLAVVVLFFLVWWVYQAISFGLFALPAAFLLVFVPALGVERYTFPSAGVRIGWLVVHIAALLAAYAALGFSLLASAFYLLQERRLKSKPRAGEDTWWAPFEWLPPLDTLERIANTTLLVGFPCMTVGLVIGSVLAAGDGAGRGLLPRSQDDCRLYHVGGLLPAAAGAAHGGAARAQGGISVRRGVCGDAGGVDGQRVQPAFTGTVPI